MACDPKVQTATIAFVSGIGENRSRWIEPQYVPSHLPATWTLKNAPACEHERVETALEADRALPQSATAPAQTRTSAANLTKDEGIRRDFRDASGPGHVAPDPTVRSLPRP